METQAARVIAALESEPAREWQIEDIAASTGLFRGQVQSVLSYLIRHGKVIASWSGGPKRTKLIKAKP